MAISAARSVRIKSGTDWQLVGIGQGGTAKAGPAEEQVIRPASRGTRQVSRTISAAVASEPTRLCTTRIIASEPSHWRRNV